MLNGNIILNRSIFEEIRRKVKLGDFFLKKVLEEGLHL